MILAISRFRVRNGMEEAVDRAFVERPRFVDDHAGFLGMEVYRESADPTVFHLVTRWTDPASFEAWHGSAAHKDSHRFIPKGLKLDAEYTRMTVMERIEPEGSAGATEAAVLDAAPFLAGALPTMEALLFLRADRGGRIQVAQGAATRVLGLPAEAAGHLLWPLLIEPDAARLRTLVEGAPARLSDHVLRLNFSGADHVPFTLHCRLDVHPDHFVLLGEPELQDARALETELLGTNNELTVMTREATRRERAVTAARAELARTLEELQASYWHLRRIQEVLPICMECSKVKTGERRWEDVVTYLRENALFLSHGYCPSCAERVLAEAEAEAP